MDLTHYSEKIIGAAETVLTSVVNISIFLMMIMISINAIGRYVFSSSLTGSHTMVTQFLMPVLVFFSLSRIQHEEANINVNIFSRNFSERRALVVNLFQRIVILGIFVYITFVTGESFWDALLNPTSTVGIISFPTYLTKAIVPFGFGLLCIRLLSQIVTDVFRLGRNVRGNE